MLVVAGAVIWGFWKWKKNVEFVYDGKAVFLTITLTFFAMLMAGADVAIQQADIYMHL